MRAKDAYTFLKNTPSPYTQFELIQHKKEIGINSEASTLTSDEPKRKKKEKKVIDDDGFTMTV